MYMLQDFDEGRIPSAPQDYGDMARPRASWRLEEFDIGDEEPVPKGFRITDDQLADWAVRKIVEARQERDAAIEHHRRQEEIAKSRCEASEQFFRFQLEEYFRSVPRKRTKTQESYQLRSGKLVLRHEKEQMKPDEGAFIDWLKASGYDEYVRVTEKAAWGEAKKLLAIHEGAVVVRDTGEVVSSVVVEKKPAEFAIEGIKDAG